MTRFILLALAVHSLAPAVAIADEYLLRLDTVGYIDKPTSEEEPKETFLRSIEVLARPQSTFHGKVNIGTQTLTLAGELRRDDTGALRVRVTHVYSCDTGTTVLVQDGRREPMLDTMAVTTEIAITVGDPVTIGASATTTEESGKPKRKSKTRYVLTLAKYEPANG